MHKEFKDYCLEEDVVGQIQPIDDGMPEVHVVMVQDGRKVTLDSAWIHPQKAVKRASELRKESEGKVGVFVYVDSAKLNVE